MSNWAAGFFLFLVYPCFVQGGELKEHAELSAVYNLTMPHFNEDGHLFWELYASKVIQKEDCVFLTIDPTLSFYDGKVIDYIAKSSSGIFNTKVGRANGAEKLEVFGNGFSAEGNHWSWESLSDLGENHIKFLDSGRVLFPRGLGSHFSTQYKMQKPEECSPKENFYKGEASTLPTVANAIVMDLVKIDQNTHRFILEGNVSVEGENLFLTCEKMEILLVKENNTTEAPLGQVSKIFATGSPILKQLGRTSFCKEMTLDAKLGMVLLYGAARVVDEEWGEAIGEKIILEKGTRMARVVGEEEGRARILLPPLPNLGFEKKHKKGN